MAILNMNYGKKDTGKLIFDFQNDGDLGWTASSPITFSNGQGWTITSNNGHGVITPPSSIFNGKTLKKVKFLFYKSQNTGYNSTSACQLRAGSDDMGWAYNSQNGSTPQVIAYISGTSHRTDTIEATGDVEIEYTFGDDGSIQASINGTVYNIGNYGSVFRNAWTNKTLLFLLDKWTWSGTSYIRKIEIETE